MLSEGSLLKHVTRMGILCDMFNGDESTKVMFKCSCINTALPINVTQFSNCRMYVQCNATMLEH